ncbi:MAG: hypothetical protein D6711_06140 [Chloroflexi bacterium]|nr:MAG: hypothetical protein D6711_06140 [Chloroflexota bacterium]
MKNIVRILFLVAILAGSVVFSTVSPTQAQVTPGICDNPVDVLTAAFCAAREAIEEERSIDLTIVKQWTFEQQEFTNGIDWGCIDGIAAVDVRPVYYGWEFRFTALNNEVHTARVSFVDLDTVAVCDEVALATDAPAPSTAPTNPNLPAPVTGAGAAGTFELGGHVNGLGTQTVSNMQAAGMTWVKKQLRFRVGDGTGQAEAFINDANSKGFKILLGIVGYTDEMTNYDQYIQDYATFVGQVAAKMTQGGAIEVWNEPNIDREWPNGRISGAEYTRLLAAAYNAIKTANPNVIVISGAPAPTGAEAAFPGAVVNDDNFMRQMRDAGAAAYMDCLGLHYNEGIVSPTQNSGDPRPYYPTQYFGSMLARGANIFPDRPVCWTELGYLSGEGMGEPIPPAFSWAENVTVAQQAQWLAEAAQLSRQSGRVRIMIIWNVNFELWGSDPMGGYAMMRPDGTCPACSTLGAVMRGS